MQPLRVLLMISSMRGGGSERQVLLLSKHLDRKRFEVHLYLTDPVGDYLAEIPSDVRIHSFHPPEKTPDPFLARGVYFPGRALRRQCHFLQKLVANVGIDVVYDRTFHMSMLAGGLSRSIRRVSTIVSPPHLALPLVEKRFVALKRRRLSRSYRRSDVVVAVSEQAARSAETYYHLPKDSVTVIRNPVEFKAVRPTQRSGETTLVCVGRMTAEKGHAVLLDALERMELARMERNDADKAWPANVAPWSLRLVGDGPLRGELEQRVRELGFEHRVTFLGKLADASNEIAGADALVLPSLFEGLPNVVLEAMSLETPVIATRAGGTIELQQQHPTAFWAQPGDAVSLAQAIVDFANQPHVAGEHVKAAYQLVLAEHEVAGAVKSIESLLEADRAGL